MGGVTCRGLKRDSAAPRRRGASRSTARTSRLPSAVCRPSFSCFTSSRTRSSSSCSSRARFPGALGQPRRCADHRDDGRARRRDQLLAVVPVAAGGRSPARVGDADGHGPAATGRGRRRRCETSCPATSSGSRPAIWYRPTRGLLESRDLSVQQSMLTGESLPADKACGRRRRAATTGPDAPDLVFLGTSVVSGTGTAVALATGAEDDVRRYRGAAAEPRARDRVRTRPAAIQPADPANDGRAGAVHPARGHRAQARRVRIAAVCGRPGRRPHAGIPAR